MNWWQVVAGVAVGVWVVAGVTAIVGASATPVTPSPSPEPAAAKPKRAVKATSRIELPDDEALAKLYIRAMIQAARADDRIDAREHQRLMDAIAGANDTQRDFVTAELTRPRNVLGLIGDTPRGHEEQVYLMALASIDPDNRAEREFLDKLAQAFGLSSVTRRAIHTRLGLAGPVTTGM